MVAPNSSYFDLVDTEVLLKSDCNDKFLRNKRGVVKKVSNKNIATIRVHSLDSDIRIPCVCLETVAPELYDNCKVISGPHSSLLGQIGKLMRVKDDDGYVQFLSDKTRTVRIPRSDLARYIKAKKVDSHKLSLPTNSDTSKHGSSNRHEFRLSIPLSSVSTQSGSNILISPSIPLSSSSARVRGSSQRTAHTLTTPTSTLLVQEVQDEEQPSFPFTAVPDYSSSPWNLLRNPPSLMHSVSTLAPTYHHPRSPTYSPTTPTYSPASPSYNPKTPPYMSSTPLSQPAFHIASLDTPQSSLTSSSLTFQPPNIGFFQDNSLLFNNSGITIPDSEIQFNSPYRSMFSTNSLFGTSSNSSTSRGTFSSRQNDCSEHNQPHSLLFMSPDSQQHTVPHQHSLNGSLRSRNHGGQNMSPYLSRPSVIQYPLSVQSHSSSSTRSSSPPNGAYFVNNEQTRQLAMRANSFLTLARDVSNDSGERLSTHSVGGSVSVAAGRNGGRAFYGIRKSGSLDPNRVDKIVKLAVERLVRQQRSYVFGGAGMCVVCVCVRVFVCVLHNSY